MQAVADYQEARLEAEDESSARASEYIAERRQAAEARMRDYHRKAHHNQPSWSCICLQPDFCVCSP